MKNVKTLTVLTVVCFLLFGSVYSEENHMSIFTDEELDWLEAHPVIRVAPEDDYAPVEYYYEDEFVGLSSDYLDWISETYDIQFEIVYYKTWSEILDALKNEEVDIQTAIVKTPERTQYLHFTDPYASVPNVVLVRKDFDVSLNIDTVFNYKVGIIKDYAVHEYIKLVHSPTGLYEYTDIRESLTDLSLGKIDALVIDLAQASYYIQEMAISNVTISDDVKIDFEYKLRFATIKDYEILSTILNKAIKSMPEIKRQELINKWIYFGEYSWVDQYLLGILLSLIGIIFLFFLVTTTWSITLKRQVNIKTKELDAELKHSRDIAKELELLTKELEKRVEERSKSLVSTNEHLEFALVNLEKKEMKLSQMNQLLEDHIDILEETQLQLIEAEKINALSRLVIGIAHEVNTPLGNGITVISYAKHIIEEMSESIPTEENKAKESEYQEYLEELRVITGKALDYLKSTAKIIDDFRSVADYHYVEGVKELTLDKEIKDIVNLLKQQRNLVNYTFNLDLQENVKVNISSSRLFQILSVMVENTYTHGYLEASNGVIDISLRKQGNNISLTFKDYGKGISKEIINQVFEPFYTSQRGSKSMGLGLYSAYNLVKSVLGGKIAVDSIPNEGTTFKITFKGETTIK